MSYRLFLLLLGFSLVLLACDSNRNAPAGNETVADASDSTVAIFQQPSESTPFDREAQIRAEIDAGYTAERLRCSPQIDAVTDFNGKKEFWRICTTDTGTRVIQIDSHWEEELYTEVYFEQNGELVYAEEWIKYLPINHYVLQIWRCQFYVRKGALVSYLSLGHGKTEKEDWDPAVIFTMYDQRLEELTRIETE